MEKNNALSRRENYAPSSFTRFLWWLSTAEPELLADSVIDRNRYSIIGMTVLATWAFACLIWTYFFMTIVDGFFLPLFLGLFMGFIILTIDRALIKGINKFNRQRIGPLLFRGLLAITIGTFMAQPAVLYLFDKEVRLQASLDNEKRKMLKRQELDALYKNRENELRQQIVLFNGELEKKYNEVSNARQGFIAETDGSGGSGKIGIKDIALAKQTEYRKLDGEYQALLKDRQPLIDSARKEMQGMELRKQAAETEFMGLLNNGFLTRIEAMSNLLKNNPAVQFRYWLIIFILVLIELMPVLSKTLLPSGSYDEKVRLREELENDIAGSNIRKEEKLKELYNQMAYEHDAEAVRAFFDLTREDRHDKIRNFSKKWKEENGSSFDGFWEKMKRDILTKQEN